MEDEINLLDYWRVLLKWKRTIILFVMAASIAAVIISLLLPKTYKAEATIMPIGGQKGGGLSAIAAQMGLGGLLGGMVPTSTSSSQILAILKSKTLAEKMIEKYELMKVFYPEEARGKGLGARGGKGPTMEDAVKALRSIVKFMDDKKNQTINISAEMRDPQKAAKIVNGFLTELSVHINENTFTEAKRNRIFVEGQLERNKMDLLESGKELTSFYATNRISNVVPTVDVDVSMGGEVESGKGKVGELQKQVEDIKAKIEQVRVVQGVPQQIYLQYLTLRRELLGQVNALLTQQYEMAKIDEAKEDLSFQVIDLARVPIRKFKPKRAQICMTAFVMSLFLSIFYAFFREYLEKMKGMD